MQMLFLDQVLQKSPPILRDRISQVRGPLLGHHDFQAGNVCEPHVSEEGMRYSFEPQPYASAVAGGRRLEAIRLQALVRFPPEYSPST